jgi:hypothetical protein
LEFFPLSPIRRNGGAAFSNVLRRPPQCQRMAKRGAGDIQLLHNQKLAED